MRALIGVDHFQVHHVTHNRVVIRDSIAAKHVARAAGDIQCLAAGIALDQANEVG